MFHGSVLRTAAALHLGIHPRALYAVRDSGALERLSRGLYRLADRLQVFGDERLTAALLDRLTHKAHILEFAGAESYRFRERMQREARRESNDRADG